MNFLSLGSMLYTAVLLAFFVVSVLPLGTILESRKMSSGVRIFGSGATVKVFKGWDSCGGWEELSEGGEGEVGCSGGVGFSKKGAGKGGKIPSLALESMVRVDWLGVSEVSLDFDLGIREVLWVRSISCGERMPGLVLSGEGEGTVGSCTSFHDLGSRVGGGPGSASLR